MSSICLANTTGSSTPEKSAQCGQRNAQGEGWHRRILCIDDDPVVLSLERALLTAAGFAVITSGNAVEALRLFCSELPDAVILDYSLSGTTSAGLAARMRGMDDEVPLILNSGALTVPAREAALFDRVLPKGLAPALLVRILREMFPVIGNDSCASPPRSGNCDASRNRDAIDERG